MECDLGELRCGEGEERGIEEHVTHRHQIDGALGERAFRRNRECGLVDALRHHHEVGPGREERRHQFRFDHDPVHPRRVRHQGGHQVFRAADDVEGVGAEVDQPCVRGQAPHRRNEHFRPAGLDEHRVRADDPIAQLLRDVLGEIGIEPVHCRGERRGHAARMDEGAPQVALQAVDGFDPVGGMPQRQARVALEFGEQAHADRRETDVGGAGEFLRNEVHAGAAWRAIIVARKNQEIGSPGGHGGRFRIVVGGVCRVVHRRAFLGGCKKMLCL